MEETTDPVFDWRSALTDTWISIVNKAIEYLPEILSALILILVGWLIARLLGSLARKSVVLSDRLLTKVAGNSGWYRDGIIRPQHARGVGQLVFWLVFLFFTAAASAVMGWQMFSGWMSALLQNLPNVITGVLIVFVGYLLARVAQLAVHTAATSANINNPDMLARVARTLTFFTALIIGIEQAGINVGFLTNVLLVVVAVLLFGAALAFGLGARMLVANIIGIQQFKKHVRLGETLRLGDIEGTLIETTQTSIILDTDNGRQIIPAHTFLRRPVELRSEIAVPSRDVQPASNAEDD